MKKDKQGTLEMNIENTVRQLKTNYKNLETHFKNNNNSFLKHSLFVAEAVAEAAVVSAFYGVGAGVMTSVSKDLLSCSTSLASSLSQVRPHRLGIMMGVEKGMRTVMRKFKGKEDLETILVASFSAGVTSGVVCGDSPMDFFATGVLNSLFLGGVFKIGEKLSQQKQEAVDYELYYKKGRSMLSSLGLDGFQKNFKRGLFTDKTLPLLTDSDLREVNIPPGPRRLILDHIQRDKEVKNED